MLPIKLQLPEGFLEEEVRCGYTVSEKMKGIWAVELDLLNLFDGICKEYGLHYFLWGGTLLGAIRHGGYIPWDNDIDVVMMREEYERLCGIASQAIAHPYFFQTEKTDPGSRRGHAQLRNSLTTGILQNELVSRLSINQGIWIDIFPLDTVPDDLTERVAFYHKLYQRRQAALRFGSVARKRLSESSTAAKRLAKNAIHPFAYALEKLFRPGEKLYGAYEVLQQKYRKCDTERIGLTTFPEAPDRVIYMKRDYAEAMLADFEMLRLPVPVGYDSILQALYGDWREPVMGGSFHGGVLFDAHSPYTAYTLEGDQK